MWEEMVKDASGKLIEEVELRSVSLRCSREVAYYILKLEERLDRIESDVDIRHGRLLESIDHLQTVLQRSLESY